MVRRIFISALQAYCRVTRLAALGKKEGAKRLYREALPYFRRKAAAQTALGDLQREAGNVKAAIGSYSAAARMDSRYPDPWLALHEIAREQGQDGLARRYKGIHDRLATRR